MSISLNLEETNKITNSLIPINTTDQYLEKIEKKLQKLTKSEKILYLQREIERVQSKLGNRSEILLKITQQYINLQKSNADILFLNKKYEEALELYKSCLRQTEPLPGSEWSKYESWSKQRISLMNDIAITYEKLNKIEQAIEYIRLGINLEETCGNEGDYEWKYNGIFYSAGKQLMILEQYNEALKYLIKVEKKMYDELNIGKIIARNKIDRKLDRKFLYHNPSEYLNLLNLICKAYIKVGNYTKSDLYYERQGQINELLQRINYRRINTHVLNDIDSHKNITSDNLVNGIVNLKIKGNTIDRKYDKVEEYFVNEDELNKRAHSEIKKKTIKKLSEMNDKIDELKDEKSKRSLINNSIVNKTKKKSENKSSVSKRKNNKKLQDIIKPPQRYPPLNFSFKKPIFPKIKKLPAIDLKKQNLNLNKSIEKNILLLNQPKKKLLKPIKKKRPFSENQISERKTRDQKIKHQLNEIKKTLERQSSMKSYSNTSSKRSLKLSRSSSIKSNTSKNSEAENINSNNNNELFSKRSSKEIKDKNSNNNNKRKKNYIINSIPINNKPKIKKLEFPSENKKNDFVNSEENRKNEEEKDNNINIKYNELSFRDDQNQFEEKSNDMKNSEENINEEKNEIKINKVEKNKFQPEKIDFESRRKKSSQLVSSDNITKRKMSTLSFIELIKSYYNKMHLLINEKFDKKNLIHKTFEFNDICIVKTIHNELYSIIFTVPFLNQNKKSKVKGEYSLPFIEIEVLFKKFNLKFYQKYKIKLILIEELKIANEDLIDDLITNLSGNLQIDLSWEIALYYFENYFSIFKLQYERNLYEEADEVNKEFYKNFINLLNNYIDNIDVWKTKKILMDGEKNNYINIIMKYFQVFIKYMAPTNRIMGKVIENKDLEIEKILLQIQKYYDKINGILKIKNQLNQIGNIKLIKRLIYDSFLIEGIASYKKELKKEEKKESLFKEEDIENLFYDNQIIFKGIVKLQYHYMYICLSIRTFQIAIKQANKIKIVEVPHMKFLTKSKYIDFDNLKFLSTNEEIVNLYTELKTDLAKKFYDKTKYKTFLQFSIVDLQSSSGWYDFSYISWEIILKIFNTFQNDVNYKQFLDINFTQKNICLTQKLDKYLGVFLIFYISKFCSINNGGFEINTEVNNDDIYKNMFLDFYYYFDYYNYNNPYNKKKYFSIPFSSKNFFVNYISRIHNNYYKMYFKNNKFYNEEKVIINDETNILNNVAKTQKSEEEVKPLSFNIYLKIGKNRYNALFKLTREKLQITNDPNNLKNYLIPSNKILKLFVQLRCILSDELIHYQVSNEKYIKNIISVYENNEEYVLKSYFENLIKIIEYPYGKHIIFDLSYKKFNIQSQRMSDNNSNLLKKIALMLKHKTNDKLENIIDGIKFIKTYKRCFKSKNNQLIVFNYRVYQDSEINFTDNKKILEISSEEGPSNNLYSTIFGELKISNFAKKMNKKYNSNQNFQYGKSHFFIYFIDVYFPLSSLNVNFILSGRDLNFILKKIKNKNIQAKYLTSSDELIKLIPRKITIRNEEGGKKVLLNFTKYKHLRMDWKAQLEYKKIKETKSELPEKFKKYTNKQFELMIFLKTSFINISIKDSLYEISTNEMVLVIKSVKIYEINNKKYTCIVSMYYHKILEYWNLYLFFPHNARKFITTLEPKEVTRIVTSENFMNMHTIDDNSISEKEIWKFIIDSSIITSNIEGNAYFEVFNTKLLLREFLYDGFEIISDGYNEELNRIIYVSITLKTKNLFLLEQIENVIKKVEIDTAHLIFQSFSFHDLSWHKENFILADFEPFFKNKIISDKNVIKLKEISKEEEILKEFEEINKKNEQNKNYNIQSKLKPKIVEKSRIEIRKFIPFSFLRKMTIPIIKPYVNSQQHMFEKQMKSIENKGIQEGSLDKLINLLKYDRAHKKAVNKIYRQKLDNQILFQRIYSEYISFNPPILASVGLNLVKEKIIITLYYPYPSDSYDIYVDFDNVRRLFFPYFNDILVIDKFELGKRIMKRYENFIKTSPHFLKLFRK